MFILPNICKIIVQKELIVQKNTGKILRYYNPNVLVEDKLDEFKPYPSC